MALFEQNQQNQFNMNNNLEQIKQWQAEADKAAAAIGAAELEAEEELLGVRLKNLSKAQQKKLAQLGQVLELEEKGIQELAKLKLTLSNRQFAVRKKEIQKEFQLYKAAAEELFKLENKQKFTKPTSAPKKTSSTEDLKASTRAKSADVAIQKANRKVQSATYSVDKVRQEITNAISSIQEVATASVAKPNTAEAQQKPHVDSTPITDAQVKAPVQREYADNSSGLEKVDLGKELFDSVLNKFDAALKANNKPDKAFIDALDKVIANGGENISQYSLDLADSLLDSFEEAEKAIRKVRELNENKIQNIRLLRLTEEQRLSQVHAQTSFNNTVAKINAYAKQQDIIANEDAYRKEAVSKLSIDQLNKESTLALEKIAAEAKLKFVKNNEERILDQEAHKLRIGHINAEHDAMNALIAAQAKKDDIESNRSQYLEEALQKLKVGHATKENELRLAGIDAEAKANDLKNNRETYELEARLARENAFYEERNRLEVESIEIAESIAWDRAHIEEVMSTELHKKRLGYAKEYGEYLRTAGKYAVSQEKFEENKAKKELASSKKDAVSGITDAIKTGEFSKIWSADNKEAYTKYMGQRTAELEKAYMAKFDKDNPEATEEERVEAKAKAEASAKLTAQFELVADAARDLAQTLNAQTDKIGAKQAPIDTRLQGSTVNDRILGSYWKQLARDMNKVGAVNPYFTQEDFANNIETLVNKGISFDIKQRAFLMTIQEKIANTFDAADGTLLRLIRIQQQDTTAGRLGMESALNSFLNSMYETSEYLTDVASSVRSSLGELQALMEGAAGTELEFQVQKWMGSLYSVGMSQDAVQNIAQAFGQIASGDISGLTGSGVSNLLIMAANEAGMSIADILQDGLNADETNKLMQAMVNYLAEIAETSSDSRVVQQQLANVYGVKASDLRAATNLASSIKEVSNQDLTYGGMLGQLNKMANSMVLRTSTGEMLSNVWDNVQYTMATQMSNDPILYLLPRVATLLEDYAGGIDLPFLNVMGFGVDLNTSVAQLMNVAAVGGSILGALGPMISGLASAANGSVMLNLAGINTSGKAPVIARGSAQPLQHLGGSGISESGYIGNSSGEDVKNATLQDAEDSKKKQMVEAKDEESSDDVVIRSQQAIIDIYNLLEEVAHGSQSLRVRVINNNSAAIGQNPIEEAPNTNPTMNTDNGNWVLSF